MTANIESSESKGWITISSEVSDIERRSESRDTAKASVIMAEPDIEPDVSGGESQDSEEFSEQSICSRNAFSSVAGRAGDPSFSKDALVLSQSPRMWR